MRGRPRSQSAFPGTGAASANPVDPPAVTASRRRRPLDWHRKSGDLELPRDHVGVRGRCHHAGERKDANNIEARGHRCGHRSTQRQPDLWTQRTGRGDTVPWWARRSPGPAGVRRNSSFSPSPAVQGRHTRRSAARSRGRSGPDFGCCRTVRYPRPVVRYAGRDAPVAQRIEHLTTDQKVWGSNPYRRARHKAAGSHPADLRFCT